MRRLLSALRHPISQNAIALYGVQFATYIVPLVTLPYVARVLNESGFGLVVFAQGFSFLLGLVITYSFDLTATREVAAKRNETGVLGGIAARVLGGKLLLAVVALVVALGALLVVPKLRANPDLLGLALLAALATGLNPGWFFVGIERLRLVALVQLGSRVLSAGLTFVFVTSADDAWVILALYAGASLLASGIGHWLMYRRIPRVRPRIAGSLTAIRQGWLLFVGTGAFTLYTSANVVVLGLFVSSAQVAHFGAAERIVRASSQVLGPAATVVFPRLAYLQASDEATRARRLGLISVVVFGAIGGTAALALAILAPVIIPLVFGPEFDEAIVLLRILGLLVFLSAVANALVQWMFSLHMDQAVVRIVIAAGVSNLALALVLVPRFGPVGMACSVLVAEVVAVLGCVRAIRRNDATSESGLLSEVRMARRSRPVTTESGDQ